MGIFDKIRALLPSGRLKKEETEQLRTIIWDTVRDGHISDSELDRVNGFYLQSGLDEADFMKLKEEVFFSIVSQAISDRRVDQNEIQFLEQLVERFGISETAQASVRERLQLFHVMAEIEAGAPLPVDSPPGVVLQKGELCHVAVPATLFEERVVARKYQGGTQGINVRLAKGVRYRIGQQKGTLVSQTGMVPVSDGYFVVTNKRLIFSGSRKTVPAPISKLLDLHIFSDGINYSVSNRAKPVIVRLQSADIADLCGLVISRIVNEP
jgi:hypothetical protein